MALGWSNGPGRFPRGSQPERTRHRAGFMMFIIASIAWMIDGWLEGKAFVDRSVALVSEG